MNTLLLRLKAPMQAWGTDSRYGLRLTGSEPSKSGVIGLVCAALGKPRHEAPDDGWPSLARLAELRMGVRVDRPGELRRDYQTAGGTHRRGDRYGVASASGGNAGTVVSPRYYLADADFLVGLEDDDLDLLWRLEGALRRPVWQLCLGRKAFVPGVPVWLPAEPPLGPGIRPTPLEETLGAYPWLSDGRSEAPPERLLLVLDADPAEATGVRQDVPVSFAERRFALRHLRTAFVLRPDGSEGGG